MLDITTPAIIFPAISVLMLAYTNKFIAISKRTRALHSEYTANPSSNLQQQIKILSKRMKYIRNMQISALSGFSVNILSILFVFLKLNVIATALFLTGLSLVFVSLIICIIEIYNSAKVMGILLDKDLK